MNSWKLDVIPMFVIQFTFCHVSLFPEFSQNDIFSPQFTHNYNTATSNTLIRKQLNIILTLGTSTRIVLRAVRADLIVNERKLRALVSYLWCQDHPWLSSPVFQYYFVLRPMIIMIELRVIRMTPFSLQTVRTQNMTDIRDCENIAVYTHKQRRDTHRST